MTYNPQTGNPSNKAYAVVGIPSDNRFWKQWDPKSGEMYFDPRPFFNKEEVLAYFDTDYKRTGNFDIDVSGIIHRFVNGELVPADGLGKVSSSRVAIKTTISEIRGLSESLETNLFQTTDSGQEGTWKQAPGTFTPDKDNTGTFLVDSMGRGFQRSYFGPVYADWFGAKGDAVTDDTIAIQRFLDYVTFNGLEGILGAKTYRVTNTLYIGSVNPPSSPYVESSFHIRGTNIVGVNNRGTRILVDATGLDAYLSIRKGAARANRFSDFQIESKVNPSDDVYTAEHGIKFETTFYSNFKFTLIGINGARKGIAIYRNGGSNGEFGVYDKVTIGNAQQFFYMGATTGQAFGQVFRDCAFNTNISTGSPEYVAFEFGDGQGGYGIRVDNFHSTVTRSSDANLKKVTLLHINGSSSNVQINYGRCEGYTSLMKITNSSVTPIVISNMEFPAMGATKEFPIVESVGDIHNTVILENLALQVFDKRNNAGLTKDYQFYIKLDRQDNGYYLFDKCNLQTHQDGAFNTPFVVNIPSTSLGIIEFKECFGRVPQSTNRYRYNQVFRGSSTLKDTGFHLGIRAGKPQNLILSSTFTSMNLDANWQFNLPFVAYNNFLPTSRTSFNKVARVGFQPGQIVYQDILPATSANVGLNYMASLSPGFTGSDELYISLVNSVSGIIYQRVVLTGNLGDSFKEIILQARRNNSDTGFYRLIFEAPSTNLQSATLDINYQTASTSPNFIYADSGLSFAHNWTGIENVYAFSRLQIPKRLLSNNTPDRYTDIAIHPTTNRLNIGLADMVLDYPRMTFGATIPTTGTYLRDDIIIRLNWVVGNNMGWICMTGGTPGVWVPFGKIGSNDPVFVSNTTDVVNKAFLNATYPIASYPIGTVISYYNQGKEYRRETATIWSEKPLTLTA